MTWRNAKVAWCPRCNCERPLRKSRGKGENAEKRSRIYYVCTTCWDRVELPTKYRSTPTRSRHTGRTFMSKKEANREPVLLAQQNSGQITDLRYQVPFRLELYGTQAVDALLTYLEMLPDLNLPKFARDVRRSRQCVAIYKADFVYRTKDGALVVEDPKGARTPVYTMKKRLMVLAHNVEISEPGEGGVQQRARGCGISGRGTGARLMGGR